MSMTLTTKQHAFVILYVANIGATPKQTQTQIAIDAGYSERSAHSTASDLLKNPKIQRAIAIEFEKHAMPKNEVLYHLSNIARGDVKETTLGDRLRALDMLAKYHNLTNTTQLKTWEDEAIEAIRNGEVDYNEFVETFGDESLAQQLFKRAGVPIHS